VQKVEEPLATAGVLGRRVCRKGVECDDACAWCEREEGAVEPAA
jgi:hypothetical protein